MTFNTGNPIGSTDARDLSDNAENMDYLENSTTELTHPDRLGTVRKTRHGMEVQHDNQISAHEVEHDAQISAHEVEHDNQMQSFETDFNGRLAGMAFTRVGSFTTGATLTDMPQVLVWEASQGGDGHEYGWTGSFSPSGKVVIAGSNPETTGGIGAGAWVDRTDVTLRDEVRETTFQTMKRSYAEAGFNLVDGSFQMGGSLSGWPDVLWDWATGVAYQWHLDEAKTIPSGSNPETTGGIGVGAWVDLTDVTLRSEVKASIFSIGILVKDAARQAVEGATGGKVTIMYDAQGNPNYMFRVPKFNLQDIDITLGTGVHPAFIVNGVAKSEIWIGQHTGSLVNGVLCSLPGQDPANSMSFDEAVTYCRNKGAGWHLMTNAEWAAIKLWCLKNGFLPRGNSNYGRSSEASYETGTRYDGIAPGTASETARTITGSGPASWRHNNDFAGIADLAGNVWEWASGLRLNNGEIQVLANNDAALATADLSSASADWRAISMTDGSLVLPGSANTAKFDSDAVATSGTGSRGAFTLSNVIANRLGPVDDSTNNYQFNMQTFEVSKVMSGLTAPAILKALGLYPHATDYGSDYIYMRNYGERLPIAGGNWAIGISGGVFALHLRGPRSSRNSDIGARPAFIA